ncbi:conserved hypothetical protein [Solidesulfovibrio fructosivorans JJ]]|uniref:Uncharacterized protein n=2 Tax=Solidesulfovibrio fructosivorans TaxID=878 RepID=E1JV93_SOLFR|nr:conserved hypothetical protein [Solidesulfovibrio fructosivorans JJ]]
MSPLHPIPHTSPDKALRRCTQALILTLCVEGISWPFDSYEFIIFSHLPPILYDWLPFLLSFTVISTELYSVFLPIRYFRKARFRLLYQFFIVLLAHSIISHTNPSFTNIHSYHAFRKNEREYIAKSYCSGKLPLGRGDCERYVRLPQKWQALSLMSDHVDIECYTMRPQALFYTRWGFFSYWEALLYRFDGSYPDDPLILRSYKITRLDDHWFYIVH